MFPNFVILIIFSLPSVIAFHVLEDKSDGSYRICLNTIVDDFFEKGEFIYVIADDMDDDDALLKIPQPKIILNANWTEKYSAKPSLISYNYIIRAKTERSLRGQLKYLLGNGMLRKKLAPKCKFLVITSEIYIKPMFKTMWNCSAFDVIVLVVRNLKWYHSDPFTLENGCGKAPNVTQEHKCTERVKVAVTRSFRGNKYCPVHYENAHENMKNEAATFIFILLGVLKEQYHYNITIDRSPANSSTRLLLHRNHREYLDGVSQEFFIEKCVWFLPVPEKLSGLEIYVIIFQTEVWVMFFAGFALALVIYVVIAALHGLPINMSSFIFINLEILSVTLWGSHSISPKIRAIRLFLLFFTFYAIVIQTAYTSNLIRVLTIPQHEKGIETLEELANSSLHVHTHQRVLTLFKKYRNHHKLIKKFEPKLIPFPNTYPEHYPALVLQQLIKYNNCSVMMNENRAAAGLRKLSNKNITLINNKIIFDTSLFGHYANVLSYDPIPDYHFLHHLDMTITALKENGIYTRLAENKSTMYKEVLRTTGHSTDPQVLSIEHLYGIFVIYGFGIFMACIVFIVEIIIAKWSLRKIYSPVIVLHAPQIQSCSNNDNN